MDIHHKITMCQDGALGKPGGAPGVLKQTGVLRADGHG